MLSPESYYKQVPTTLIENLEYRKRFLSVVRAHGDAGRQAARQMCRDDIIFYINVFGWQYNPKKPPKKRVGPFICWDFQEEALLARPETHKNADGTPKKGLLWCVENNKTAVVEKSREMGATWLFLFLQDWLSAFHEYSQSLNISRDEDAVDAKSPDSLFWKLRFINEHRPEWLANFKVDQKMYFEYEHTKSVITGEASTGRAGVGGRAGMIFLDEFSLVKDAKEIRRRTANTSDVRFFNGTHNGQTEFLELTKSSEVPKIIMHWTQHPEKKRGSYRFDAETNRVEVLDKSFHFGPQCPECSKILNVPLGAVCPDCRQPTREFQFVMSGLPTGGPQPGVRSPWYDWKSVDIGDARGVAMELDIDPVGSVTTFFSPLKIDQLIRKMACLPWWEGEIEYDPHNGRNAILVPYEGGRLKLWCNLNEGKPVLAPYYGGLDVSYGTGATPSCLSLGNGKLGEKVLEYRSPVLDPKDFAILTHAVCTLFLDEEGRGPMICWEKQGPGVIFGRKMIELGYRNVFWQDREDVISGAKKNQLVPGWNPTPTSKTALFGEYRYALEHYQIVNRSELALRDTLLFTYDRNSQVVHRGQDVDDDPSGARVGHADMATADALMWKMMKASARGEKPKAVEKKPTPYTIAGRMKMAEDRQREQEEVWIN